MALQPIKTVLSNIDDATITANKLNVGQLSGRKNIVINGAMQIAQRSKGLYGSTSGGYIVLDRWYFQRTATAVYNITQESSDGPNEFKYYTRVECDGTDTEIDSSDFVNYKQVFEAQNIRHLMHGTSDAKDLVLSFWVRSNVLDTFSVTWLHEGDGANYGIPLEYSVNAPNTWEKKVIKIPAITSGGVVDPTDAQEGAQLRFALMLGSSRSGTPNVYTTNNIFGSTNQTNLFDTVGNYWDITGIQLEVGEEATEFEHTAIDDVLKQCQRYFTKSYPDNAGGFSYYSADNTGAGCEVFYGDGTTGYHGGYRFPVEMRSTPSISLWTKNGTSANKAQMNFTSGGYVSIQPYTVSEKSFNILQTDAGSVSIYAFHYYADAELG